MPDGETWTVPANERVTSGQTRSPSRWHDRTVTDSRIAEAREALRVGDAGEARRILEQLEATGETLELLAAASFVLLEYPRSIEEMELAYAAYRRRVKAPAPSARRGRSAPCTGRPRVTGPSPTAGSPGPGAS